MKPSKRFKTIDEYIKTFPKNVAEKLEAVRTTIGKASPKSEEVISYNMPAFKLNGGVIVYFAGYGKHIGIYAFPLAIKAFAKELTKYKTSKSAIQLSLDEKIPTGLLKKIVQFRAEERLAPKKKK